MIQLSLPGSIKKIIGIIIIIIVAYALIQFTGISNYLSVDHLQKNKVLLDTMLTKRYWRVVFWYICCYLLIIMMAVPGFPILTIAGGFLFGTFWGFVYALIGSFIGSIISFFGIKIFMRRRMAHAYQERLDKFRLQIKRYGTAYTLLMLHFLTIIPFIVINSLAAIANVPTWTFVWTTIIGSLPLLLVYSFAGNQLYLIDEVGDIFSPHIIFLFIVLLLLVALPMFIREYRTTFTKKNK